MESEDTGGPIVPTYEGGIAVFRPSYDDFKDFRRFVNRIEPVGMKSGIVKIVPPQEWLAKLPKLPTALVENIDVRNPIVQNITINGGRGVFEIDNVEKRRKYTMKEWEKLCRDSKNQPPTRRGEKQRPLGRYVAETGAFVSYDDSDFSPQTCEELETRYWKGLAYGGSPMYGADLPGSLFDDKTSEWNVAHLDSLLQLLPEAVPGVTNAYLYCGMWKATFAWHLEDVDLPSINYIHFGAPKQWYTIPQEHHQRFYELMCALWPDEYEKCSEFLRHKTFFVDPAFLKRHNIPVNKIVHRQQEFIITFPYGYHAGFNYGFNVAESVNFAHDSWIDIGLKAKKCQCVNHSVGINVELMVDLIKHPDRAEEIHSQYKRRREAAQLVDAKSAGHRQTRLGKCVLCPHIYTNRYVTNREHNANAHIVCANLVPETWIAGSTVFDLDKISRERFALKCLFCKQSKGCCFQCSFPTCTRAYHGSCAATAGVEYNNSHAPLCRFHRPKLDTTSGALDFDPATLVPGDVVQFRRGTAFFAGVVEHNLATDQVLRIGTLPNPSESREAQYTEIVSVFREAPAGPLIEPISLLDNFGIKVKSKKRKLSTAKGQNTEIPNAAHTEKPSQDKQVAVVMNESHVNIDPEISDTAAAGDTAAGDGSTAVKSNADKSTADISHADEPSDQRLFSTAVNGDAVKKEDDHDQRHRHAAATIVT